VSGAEANNGHGAAGLVTLYSRSEVIAAGLAPLLPAERGRLIVATELEELRPLVHQRSGSAVIVDAETAGAQDAIKLGLDHGATVVLLLGHAPHRLDPELLGAIDAVLPRDEAEPLTLRLALAAGRMGLRLLPRELPLIDGTPTGQPPLSDIALRSLELLAEGMRDAEIATRLNISESAVRKLVQRTVRALGARTRCQAVAVAARTGAIGA
jgi:DNA-binding NarL/FixJ family response regulator